MKLTLNKADGQKLTVGPTGLRGLRGATGPQGIQGDPGPTIFRANEQSGDYTIGPDDLSNLILATGTTQAFILPDLSAEVVDMVLRLSVQCDNTDCQVTLDLDAGVTIDGNAADFLISAYLQSKYDFISTDGLAWLSGAGL